VFLDDTVCWRQSCQRTRDNPVSSQPLSGSSPKCLSSVFVCGWDRYQVSVSGGSTVYCLVKFTYFFFSLFLLNATGG